VRPKGGVGGRAWDMGAPFEPEAKYAAGVPQSAAIFNYTDLTPQDA